MSRSHSGRSRETSRRSHRAGPALVLPWHMYLGVPWLDNRWKRLANPAPSFFSQPTISGHNIEAGPTATNNSNPVSKYVEAMLRQGDGVGDFGSLIALLTS